MSYATTGDLVAARSDTASSAVEATVAAITSVDLYRVGSFVLDVTSTVGAGTFTLNVGVQGFIAGYAWTDIGRFAEVTATGQRFLRGVGGTVGSGSTVIEEAAQSLDITVGNIRCGPLGTQIRAIYTLVITGTLTVNWRVRYGLHS